MIKRLFGMMTFILFFRFIKIGILIGMIVLILYVSKVDVGNIQGGLKWLDSAMGEGLNHFSIASSSTAKISEQAALVTISASELTLEDKEKIDLWLNLRNLNRYGDVIDTYYAGGTPLFNEQTGERIDRYDYIMQRHPEIISEILHK